MQDVSLAVNIDVINPLRFCVCLFQSVTNPKKENIYITI